MIMDKSEKCNNCRNKYKEMWQYRRDLLDALIETKESNCELCETEWGKCTEGCTQIKRINKIIEKNKQFFRPLYESEE